MTRVAIDGDRPCQPAMSSRRATLAALFAASLAAGAAGDSTARRAKRLDRHKRRGTKERGSREKGSRRRKKKDKKGSTGKGCKVKHSEAEVLRFIAKAAKKYGQSKKVMERVARCESSLNPCAYNKSGPYYGLYQFLKSTWKTTPYSKKSIYDPKAQALAAGWMWKQGRKNEWACK